MTISTTTYKNTYPANGVDSAFAFSFAIKDASHLLVQLVNTVGTVTTQTINTDYTVSGTGNTSGSTDYTSGTVTFLTVPTSGFTVIIKRATPVTQAIDYRENDNFPADTHEGALDKLTLIAQDLQEQLDRCFKLNYTGSNATDFSLPNPVANYYLRFNSALTGLEAVALTGVNGIDNVVEDPSPQLGGNLDVNANSIVSTSNGNIIIEPNGTGEVRLNSATVTVEDDITHAGDIDTKLTFGTNTLTATVGGVTIFDLSTLGIRLNGTGNRILNIKDEDDFVSNSDTALATQQSTKAYVDTYAVNKAVPILGGNLDLDGYNIITNDGNESIGIDPHGSGSVTITTDSGGNINLNSANDITLGSDSIYVGQDIIHTGDTNTKITFTTDLITFTSAGTAWFNVNAFGVQIGSGPIITTVYDEDAMGSNSDTALATQQSIKAYVDNKSATQAQQETGTATTSYVSPGVQQYHPSACKAWAIIDSDAGTPSISADYNVASMSDGGSGVYTITFDITMSSANYAVLATPEHSSIAMAFTIRGRTTTTVSITETASATEPEFLHVAIFGDI